MTKLFCDACGKELPSAATHQDPKLCTTATPQRPRRRQLKVVTDVIDVEDNDRDMNDIHICLYCRIDAIVSVDPRRKWTEIPTVLREA